MTYPDWEVLGERFVPGRTVLVEGWGRGVTYPDWEVLGERLVPGRTVVVVGWGVGGDVP